MVQGVRTRPQALPPYRALLVVDIKDFSGQEGRHHAELTEAVPEILRQAFERGGLAEPWRERRFGTTTGDGYAAGFPSEVLPFLLNPFLGALQEELAYRNAVGWVSGLGQPLRMRVSVNVGAMTDTGRGLLSEGSGPARIENHRLLDSDPVRELLSRSGSPTCVAAIVSERAFADAVLSGYASEDADLYVPVLVEKKTYRGKAYLRVPKPSGDLLHRGFKLELPHADQAQPPAPARDGEVAASTVVHNSHGPLHTGAGHQFNGDGSVVVDRNEGGIRQSWGGRRP